MLKDVYRISLIGLLAQKNNLTEYSICLGSDDSGRGLFCLYLINNKNMISKNILVILVQIVNSKV